MKTLKENFGRRLALIGGGIIAILISLVIVASLSIQAKAADPNRAANEPYYSNQNYITALVHAPDATAFDVTFDYTVTPISLSGHTELVGDMPSLDIPALNLSVTDAGVVNSTTSGATWWADAAASTDPGAHTRREGPGSAANAPGTELVLAENHESGGPFWSWNTAPQKAYYVQLPFSEVVKNVNWPTAGEYIYTINTESSSAETTIPPSAASYSLRIFVEDPAEEPVVHALEVTGYILSQSLHDDGKSCIIEKKDPRRGFGNSNHLEPYTGTESEHADAYYYGFTFSHEVSTANQPFYVQKIVDNLPDPTINFPMTLEFYHEGWVGAQDEITINGVICDVDFAQLYVDAPQTGMTPTGSATFTWDSEHECYSATFNLKHQQRIVFDGATSYTPSGGSTVTSTLIPALTAYTCLEDLETAGTYGDYTANATAYSQAFAAGQAQQWTSTGAINPDTTKGAGKNMYVTYWDYAVSSGDPTGTWDANSQAYVGYKDGATQVNKTVITNIYDYNPTNFWLDILPYIVMIGIPIAAFVIWMLARRKKLNR